MFAIETAEASFGGGLFENLQKQNHENAEDISAIEEDLRDTPGEKGAFFCEYALQYLAMCVLLILSLVKSGSWARDIMGG